VGGERWSGKTKKKDHSMIQEKKRIKTRGRGGFRGKEGKVSSLNRTNQEREVAKGRDLNPKEKVSSWEGKKKTKAIG